MGEIIFCYPGIHTYTSMKTLSCCYKNEYNRGCDSINMRHIIRSLYHKPGTKFV